MQHFLLFFLILLSGCALPPCEDALRAPRTDRLADITKGQAPVKFPDAEWWLVYEDPQLTHLIETAIKESPKIAEAVARMEKAETRVAFSASPLWPSLSGQGHLQRFKQSLNNGVPPAFVPPGYNNHGKGTFNFSYELDFWGKNRNAFKASLSAAKAAALEAEQTKIILATTVARIYTTFSALYDELDSARTSREIRAKTVQLFKTRHQSGLENLGSFEQAKANLAMIEADIATLHENIMIVKNQLTLAVGSTPDLVDRLKRPHLKKIRPLDIPPPIPANLIARRPDLMAATMRLEALAKQVKVAKAGFYPNINLSAAFGRESLGLDFFFKQGSDIGNFGPAIYLPIFKGGALNANYQGARADYHQSLAVYEYTVGRAIFEVASAVASHKALGIRITKTRAAFNAAERAYQVIQDRYKGGLSNYIEVLRAEDALVQNRRAMSQIMARAFTLDVQLIKALGGGFILPQDKKEDICQK